MRESKRKRVMLGKVVKHMTDIEKIQDDLLAYGDYKFKDEMETSFTIPDLKQIESDLQRAVDSCVEMWKRVYD